MASVPTVHPLPAKPDLKVINEQHKAGPSVTAPAATPNTSIENPDKYCSTCKEPKARCTYELEAERHWIPRLDEPKRSIGARRRAVTKMRKAQAAEAERESKAHEHALLYDEAVAAKKAHETEEGEFYGDEIDVDGIQLDEEDDAQVNAAMLALFGDGNAGKDAPSLIPEEEKEDGEIDDDQVVLNHTSDGNTTSERREGEEPPRKTRKIAKEFWSRKPPIFPSQQRVYEGESIVTKLPTELQVEVLRHLLPPSLVSIALTCSYYFYLLNDPSAHRTIWVPARSRYENPMPAPNSVVDGGLGIARTELQWAMWMFGGGKCEFCGRWTYVPPASFSLNVRVCLMQECRAHWRKQCKQTLLPITGTPKSPYKLVDSTPVPPRGVPVYDPRVNTVRTAVAHDGLQEGERVEGHGDETDPNMMLGHGDHRISPWIKEVPSVFDYVLKNTALYNSLMMRPEAAQVPFLNQSIQDAAAGLNPLGLDPPANPIAAAVTEYISARKRKAKKPSPYPQFLGEIESVIWPCEELKEYVKAGMTFVESGPMMGSVRTFGLSIYTRKKYKFSDMQDAIDEWVEAGADGTTSLLIKEWQRRIRQLSDKIVGAQTLMRWRDSQKQSLDRTRQSNDIFLRHKSKTNGMEWHDASNSPTLVRMRNLSELTYVAMTDEVWNKHERSILTDTEKLHKRRVRREYEGKLRSHRAVAASFHRYCVRHAAEWELQIMPPFRIFNTFFTVKTLPHLFKEVPNWSQWIDHTLVELRIWQDRVYHKLRNLVLDRLGTKSEDGAIDPIDWAMSLFRCRCCDEVAEARVEASMAQSNKDYELGNSKTPRTEAGMPKYKNPMTWKEIVAHECEERYDVNEFMLDLPASRLAAKACRAVNVNGTHCDKAAMVAMCKAWTCGQCRVKLTWDETYPHTLRHVWAALHGGDDHAVPLSAYDLFPKGVHRTVGPSTLNREFGDNVLDDEKPKPAPWPVEHYGIMPALPRAPSAYPDPRGALPVPENFCKKMINGTPAMRFATRLMCAHCCASGVLKKGDVGPKIYGFDGLRDHLNQTHEIKVIRNEDLMLLYNAIGDFKADNKNKFKNKGKGKGKETGKSK